MSHRPPNPLFLLLLLAAACGPARSPYTRVTADDGRVYYVRLEYTFRSETGGFMTFRDLVTKEDVRLKNGTYTEAECPPAEVDFRQQQFIHDPTRKPMAGDPVPPPR